MHSLFFYFTCPNKQIIVFIECGAHHMKNNITQHLPQRQKVNFCLMLVRNRTNFVSQLDKAYWIISYQAILMVDIFNSTCSNFNIRNIESLWPFGNFIIFFIFEVNTDHPVQQRTYSSYHEQSTRRNCLPMIPSQRYPIRIK